MERTDGEVALRFSDRDDSQNTGLSGRWMVGDKIDPIVFLFVGYLAENALIIDRRIGQIVGCQAADNCSCFARCKRATAHFFISRHSTVNIDLAGAAEIGDEAPGFPLRQSE